MVYADWLEDQDIDASHIRESISDPSNQWHWTYLCGCNRIGDAINNRGIVGSNSFGFVGSDGAYVGSFSDITSFVGSNNSDDSSCVGIE